MAGETPSSGEEDLGISADVARQVIADAIKAVRNPQEKIHLARGVEADAPRIREEAQRAIIESDPFYGSVPSSE